MSKTQQGRPRARSVIALALFLAASPIVSAAAEDERHAAEAEKAAAAEILGRLDARLATIRTLRGSFLMTFTSGGLGVPQAEKGRFAVQRPDRMRWDYADPEHKVAVSDGTWTWLWLPEERVVYRGSVSAWRKQGAFALLAGGSVAGEYEATGLDAKAAARRGNVVLWLRPRRERDEYRDLMIEIDPRSMAIVAITAVDAMGNRIGVVLSDVEENATLDGSIFRFDPPAGARIVDQDAAPPSP